MSNQARFEVFPEMREPTGGETSQGVVPPAKVPTGQFCWHFKDANGRITFIGGEAFTRREDAHRSIKGAAADMLGVIFSMEGQPFLDIFTKPDAVFPTRIIDLDENGDVIPAKSSSDSYTTDPQRSAEKR